MKIVWSELALADLDALHAYISKDSPKAARKTALAIVALVEALSAQPHIGRPGRVPGTRELVVPKTPFVAPYRVYADEVQILRVYHGAQRWPDRF